MLAQLAHGCGISTNSLKCRYELHSESVVLMLRIETGKVINLIERIRNADGKN